MKTLVLISLIVVSSSFSSYGQTTTTNAEKEILEMNRAWAEAVTKGDAATLEKIFSDDIVVTAGNGNIRNKAEEIKDATAGSDPDFAWVRPFTTENERVKIYSDSAVVTGLVKWAFKYKGQEVNRSGGTAIFTSRKKGSGKLLPSMSAAIFTRNPNGV